MNHFIVAITIFIIIYGIIISEKMNRTVIAFLGAIAFLLFHVLSQEEAIDHIDFNTIGLLVGMMIIVTIMRKSGAFQYVAIKAAKLAKGDPWKILLFFSIITAIASALLDNVTTILLIVPITLVITDALEVNATPFVIPLILVSNIGGTSTLIGDPPNIMIGSATNLGFIDFIVNLFPVVIIIFFVTVLLLKLMYKSSFKVKEENKDKIMNMDEKLAIKDSKLLKKSLIILGLTILGFVLHQKLSFDSATVALSGAALLLLFSGSDVEEVLIEIEWPTIFFFMALFVLVGGLEVVGAIDILAEKVLGLTKGNMILTLIVILWGSAIASAFLDNIPFVATMIPLIKSIGIITAVNITPLWWALALGACLGGNGTLVGASANVIASGMLSKHGEHINFFGYMKVGFPLMIASIVISTIYLLLLY